MSILTTPRKPLYLASYTVRDKVARCDHCPYWLPIADVGLMEAHMNRHIDGGWNGK